MIFYYNRFQNRDILIFNFDATGLKSEYSTNKIPFQNRFKKAEIYQHEYQEQTKTEHRRLNQQI
jgi:hypothetical protein